MQHDLEPIKDEEFENGVACLLALDFITLMDTAQRMKDCEKLHQQRQFLDDDTTYTYRATQRSRNEFIRACNNVALNIKRGLYNEN